MIAVISSNDSFLKHIQKSTFEYKVFTGLDDALSEMDMIVVENRDFCLEKTFSIARCLVLSEKPDFAQAMSYLQKGARGYGNTYMSLTHLTQAITTILNDTVWLYPKIMNSLISHGAKISHAEKSDALEKLSARQKDVALEVNKGKGNKEIAISLDITERTVKAHLSNIFEKLEIHDRLALAMLLRA